VKYHRPDLAVLPVSLAPRPAPLAGREELLAGLDTRLSAGDDRWPRVVALCGLGGAGKTSVAVEYAHRHLAETDLAWQFPAEDPTVLTDDFARLAAQLGARELLDARDPVASVHAVLAASPAGWLLLFDNAPDQASVQRFLPPVGHGRVLITSQSALWPPGQAMEVPVLDVQVAAGFLVSRTGDPDGQAAAELAGELGGLPLALEQAAAFMHATGGDLVGYLALFRQQRAGLLGRGEPAGYGKTVATTWALAFGRLEQAEPGAAGLLRLMACCAPEAVPLRLLLQPRPGLEGKLGPDVAPVLVPLLDNRLAAGDAVAALRRYSLVTPAGDGLVSVHRLVQAVTIDQMPGDLAGQWRQAAAALIEAAIPADTNPPQTWPVCAALLPHARVALADDSDGAARIANYLGESGSYAAACDLERTIADAVERVLGAEHPETLRVRRDLAFWTGQAGDFAGARDQYAALLPACERVLGTEHPDTLRVRVDLATWTGWAGDPVAARDLLAGLLPVRERVLGPEHPDTLTTRAYLASLTGQAGNPAAARDLFAGLLPVREQVLGPEHPHTLAARQELARWTGEAGNPAAARDLFAGLLPVRERAVGAQHPDTLDVRRDLAFWTGQAGDPAAAWDQYAALLPVIEQVLSAEHPGTLSVRASLAWSTGQTGDPAAARDLFAGLLPVRERVSGPEHPDTLSARVGLAWWTGQAGDAAAARDQYAALLPVRERVSGAEHLTTLIARADLARWTGRAGDAAAARDQYAALLPVIERVLGPEHPQTQHVREELGYWTNEADSSVSPGVK
jgi:Tetratricopeptide repeat